MFKDSKDSFSAEIMLENQILENIKNGKLNNALEAYRKIANMYVANDMETYSKLRFVKNHTICLLALINKAMIGVCVNIDLLKLNKVEFLKKIESSNSVKDVLRVGEEVIEKYCRMVLNNCSNIDSIVVKSAISYIHNNFSENITLDDLCNHIHISKSYFCTLFKKHTGVCFSKYLNNVRIERSKELLKKSEMSILNISVAVGFNSQSYFTKIFKSITGITPKEFRKNFKAI